jgi:hypothetical protein
VRTFQQINPGRPTGSSSLLIPATKGAYSGAIKVEVYQLTQNTLIMPERAEIAKAARAVLLPTLL